MDGYYTHGGGGGIFDPTVAVHRAFPSGLESFPPVVILDNDLHMYAYIPPGGGGADDYDGEASYGGGGFGAVPASEEEIARLEEAAAGETIGEAACAVCLDSFEEEGEGGSKIRKMPCSHGFHEGCIFRWLRVSRLCPCCRYALPPPSMTTRGKTMPIPSRPIKFELSGKIED